MGSIYKRGTVYWVKYYRDGHALRESSGSPKATVARAFLRAREGRVARGEVVSTHAERVTVGELADDVVQDYMANERRSPATLQHRLAHLRPVFGHRRAHSVTTSEVRDYAAQRLQAGAQPATVNRELATLRRCFTLGLDAERIYRRPRIRLLVEDNVREGFVEPPVFEAIVAALPSYLRDAARFAYFCGWRKGALRRLLWTDVDRAARRIYLRRAGSKNGKPYVLVMTPALAAIIARRWEARSVTRPDGTVYMSDRVFHRNGRPLGDFRKAWARACTAAGAPGLLFHDLRRSAARNLDRAGVSATVGMQVTGHATLSMWKRYRIVDEGDIERALTRVEAHNSAAGAPPAPTGTIAGTIGLASRKGVV